MFGFGNGLILDAAPGLPGQMITDSGIQQGMAFLQSELEKRDPKLYEPLVSVTWSRDIVAETGGGPVDFTSINTVDFGTTGNNTNGIIRNQTTDIPTIQANIGKNTYPVFDWANKIRVPFIDSAKMQKIGRSLDALYDDGLRLNYNKTVDQMVYTGETDLGIYGILNDPQVTSSLALANGTASARTFASKTADQILTEVNDLLTRCWARAEYDITGIPNQIGLPPLVFSALNTRLVSTAGNISILEYLLRNNIARTQGVDLQIVPMRQLIGIGTALTTGGAGTNRMIAYRNEKDKLSFDLPVPLRRIMTAPSVSDVAYLSVYYAQIGVVKFKYYQPVEYLDGI